MSARKLISAAAVLLIALLGPTAASPVVSNPATVLPPGLGATPPITAVTGTRTGTILPVPLNGSGVTPVASPLGVRGQAVVATNKFVPLAPARILDSRNGIGVWGKPKAGDMIVLPVAGVAGIPNEATALVMNLTVTEPEAPGFVTLWPAGGAFPEASSANINRAGQTVANLVTVPIGAGAIAIYTESRTHLVADVAGYYLPAADATAGRFVASAPTRLMDTRAPGSVRFGQLGANEQFDLDVAGMMGLPRTTQAAVLNLTVDQPQAAGFLSITPKGAPLGAVSSINVDRPGQVIANQVIVPLTDGWVTIYSAIAAHVIVDLSGTFTGADATVGTDGLFVPVSPGRLLDTRTVQNSPLAGAKPTAARIVEVNPANRLSVPASGVAALVVNATATETTGPGFFTLWGRGLGQPLASNLNANGPAETVPNHAVVPVSTTGFSFYTASGAHLIVDVAGYFTGTAPAPLALSTSGPPSSGPHTFLYQLSGGGYARWNPCATLTYRVNLSGAPSFARSELDKAVAKVEAATGLDLVELGETTEGNNGTPPADAKAVISFVSPAEYPGIGAVAGLGGGSYYPPWNGQDPFVASGFVLINETLGYSQGTSGTGLEGLLLHELGHMIGLNHVASTDEAMYGVMHDLPYSGYGPGDREGLWNLGAPKGCLNVGPGLWAEQETNPIPTDPTGGGPIPVTVMTAGGASVTALTGTAAASNTPALVAYCHLGPAPADGA
ncbi:MAG: hypothetical protein ACKV2O_12190 [Acidimicrobiales bacterium]